MILYGARGHAKAVYDILISQEIKVDYLVDDDPPSQFLDQLSVFFPEQEKITDNEVIIAIGNNTARKKVAKKIEDDCSFIKAVHATAYISPFSEVGKGTVVMPKAVVNANAFIGKHCIINSGAIVEHDTEIGDFVHVGPGVLLAGNVEVGEGSHIGIGASVIPGVKIGANVIIGAGSVILKDVPNDAVVVGNPGRIIKTNELVNES